MSTLYVSEYVSLAQAQTGIAMCGQEPCLVDQAVTFTTTTASSAFNAQTKFVRVTSDADCHIEFGTAPEATTSNKKMVAGQAEYFGVSGGHKVAAVDAA